MRNDFTTPRKHHKEGRRDIIDYLVCNNTPTLLYTINLGCIDVNPWTSSIHTPLNPDYIIIDLDPSDKDFTKVIAAARAAKTVFDKHRLKAFPKTSGKTGIHLYLFLQVLDGRIAAANDKKLRKLTGASRSRQAI